MCQRGGGTAATSRGIRCAYVALALGDALAAVARAAERHRLVATTHLAGAVIEAAGIVVLVWALRLGLTGLAAALCLRFVAALLLIAAFELPRVRSRPSLGAYRRLLRFGLPASVAELVSTLGAMDRWLLERITTLASVATYHLARIPSVVIDVLERAVLQAAEPWVYGARADQRGPALARLVRAYFAITIAGALAASLAAPELLALVAPPAYGAALPVIPWLTFAAVLHGGVRVVGIGSGLANQTRPWAWAGLLDLSLLAGLILLAVPKLGVIAAGGARFAAALAGFALCHWLSQRVSGLGIAARRYAGWALVCTLACAWCVAHLPALAPRALAFVLLTAATLALAGVPRVPRKWAD